MVDLIRESMAGKVAVILGVGPGQGISTVRMLINFGAKVAIVSRTGNTFGLVESSTIKAYKADATNEGELQNTRDKIIGDYGSISFVISNIGKWQVPRGTFPGNSEFDDMIRINLWTHVSVMKIFSESMKAKGGSFVLVGASRGLFKNNDLAYSVSKSGIEELVRKGAEMLRKYNIRVNGILPGSVGKEDTYYKTFPFNVTKFSEKTELEPIEVAMTSSFLASEMALGINGQCIAVDRGLSTF